MVEESTAPLLPDDAEAVGGFFDRLAVEDDEVAVLSALYDRDDEGRLVLRHASLVLGPARIGETNWAQWRIEHTIRLAWDFAEAKELPPEFVSDHGNFVAGRAVMTPDDARQWLIDAGSSGELPAVGPLPAAKGPLYSPAAFLRVFPRLSTKVARLVTTSVRPLAGFHFATDERPTRTFPDHWDIHGRRILMPATTALGISVTDTGDPAREPAAQGLLVGRMERRAWLNDVRGSGDWEFYELHVGWDPERCDPADLEVELEEWVDRELAYSRRVLLGDTELPPDRLNSDRAIVSLPTLGRGVAHVARLHDRDRALLDVTSRSKLLQAIHNTMRVVGPDGESTATREFTVGEVITPSVAERLERFERVERQYRELLEAGLAGRIITDRTTAVAALRTQLEGARGELCIQDPYFGTDPADWQLLGHLTLPIRVLTGERAQPAPATMTNVTAMRWDPQHGSHPPFHDRLYLWDGGGLSVGTSANGLGNRDHRIDRLGSVEASGWKARFDTYWNSGQYVSL